MYVHNCRENIVGRHKPRARNSRKILDPRVKNWKNMIHLCVRTRIKKGAVKTEFHIDKMVASLITSLGLAKKRNPGAQKHREQKMFLTSRESMDVVPIFHGFPLVFQAVSEHFVLPGFAGTATRLVARSRQRSSIMVVRGLSFGCY